MKDIIIGISLLWLLPWSIWATKYIIIILIESKEVKKDDIISKR